MWCNDWSAFLLKNSNYRHDDSGVVFDWDGGGCVVSLFDYLCSRCVV